jgi:hypothetical protein
MYGARYSSHSLMKSEFSRQIFEKFSNINFMKIRSVGAQLFHVDGQADKMNLIVVLRNFTNASKELSFLPTECNLCDLYVSRNKQRLFPFAALTSQVTLL